MRSLCAQRHAHKHKQVELRAKERPLQLLLPLLLLLSPDAQSAYVCMCVGASISKIWTGERRRGRTVRVGVWRPGDAVQIVSC